MVEVGCMDCIFESQHHNMSVENNSFLHSPCTTYFKFTSSRCGIAIFVMEGLISGKVRFINEAMVAAGGVCEGNNLALRGFSLGRVGVRYESVELAISTR